MSFIQLQQAGRGDKKSIYVTLATSVRVPGKKYSTQKRIHLGCLCDDAVNVVVAKTFAGTSRTIIDLSVLREKAALGESSLIEWLSCQAPNKTGTKKRASEYPNMVKKVGQTYVMLNIIQQLGLEDILRDCFEIEDGLAILYLAMYQIAETRPLYQAHIWIDEQEIPEVIAEYDFSSSETSNLTKCIGNNHLAVERFFKQWIKKLGHPSSLIFDTTSISSYSELLDNVEWGYNRDDDKLPQVNISLVSAQQNRLPVYFRMLPGSIPDVSSLKITVDLLKEHGINEFTTTLDRGFYSTANVRNMISKEIEFVLGVPHSCTQTNKLIAKHSAILRSPKHSLCYNDTIVRHAVDIWNVDMGKGEPQKKIAAHIFWDYDRQSGQEKELERKVFQIEAKANKDAPDGFNSRNNANIWLEENAKRLSGCFKVIHSVKSWHVERESDAIAAAIATKGFFVVITTKMDAKGIDILHDYRSRDSVEKLFDIFKNENGQNRLRSGNRHSVDGRLFIAFVALIIHAELENKMRKAGLLKRFSVTEMLAVMRKLERVTMESGNSYLMEMTKTQREILKLLEIQDPV